MRLEFGRDGGGIINAGARGGAPPPDQRDLPARWGNTPTTHPLTHPLTHSPTPPHFSSSSHPRILTPSHFHLSTKYPTSDPSHSLIYT